ncbi:MAG: fasciclin domain-containing protein [Bacteroides sp.]|nr:fasciclin domain-containing protein [Roseburia sp.]MCM1346203.1 fasciclin domain-containing protein [Bacteroides sp.]MCM1419970.1 fasciclin domain-containing protein [Bacteroides sp.]
MIVIDKIRNYCGIGLLLVAFAAVTLNSCKENIDDSNLYTFTGEMMIDHLRDNPDFSSYYEILGMVHPSKRSSSTMHELLAARGNYTCFAPTNEAIDLYIDSLLTIGEVSSKVIGELPDSVAEYIVFNSIIDHGNNEAIASTEFDKAENYANMNDRYITFTYTNAEDGTTVVYANTNSKITEMDIEVENGYIHVIDKVLSPSKATVADLIETTSNLSFFGELLQMTGWDERLLEWRDDAYEDFEDAGEVVSTETGNSQYPEHRYLGFTVFVEPDSVYKANGINSVADLMTYLKNNAYYDEGTSYGDDYTNPENALNQFVAYHILPELLTWNNMVIWSNEKGYYSGSPNDGTSFSVNVWEYYETLDPHRRSMKITGIRNGKRINRQADYNLVTYRERDVNIEGVKINETNGENENYARNGYYFTIDELLLWTSDVPNKVLNERMRYDICSLLPELMTNGLRLNKTNGTDWVFKHDYFDNVLNMTDETVFNYLPNQGNSGSATTWLDFQTDEWNIQGVYDFTMKLPPVPYTGTYEIRYGINANGNRGMAQIYVGQNPNNLAAYGIPLDLRLGGSSTMVNWQSDASLGSDDAIQEKDKAMRNNGYMKGPAYFFPASGVSGRDCTNCLRRIVYTGQLEAGKTYYIRFKSVLDSSSTEFFFDYLELVPKSIYNGDISEDKF